MAAYITGLSALDRHGREELEERWKYYQYDAIMNRDYSIDACIESGMRVVHTREWITVTITLATQPCVYRIVIV